VRLRPSERVALQSRVDTSFVSNKDHVAFAVEDPADPEGLGVLIVDAKTSRVEHRLRFAADTEQPQIFYRSGDEFDLTYRHAGERVRQRVAFADGSHRPVDPDSGLGSPKPSRPPSMGIRCGQSSVAGSTVWIEGATKSHAFRLEYFGEALVGLDGCGGTLSQGGRHLLCRPQEGPWVVHRLEDGKRFRHEPPQMKRHSVDAVVADDGTIAAFNDHEVVISHGDEWRSDQLPDVTMRQVAWARDSGALIIRGSNSLLLWPRAASRPTNLGPIPRTCGDVEVGRYGGLFRCGATVFDPKGPLNVEPPVLRLSRYRQNQPMTMPTQEPVFIGAHPTTGSWSYVGEHGLTHAHRGVVRLYDPKTTAKVLTFVGTDGGVIALFEDGRVDAVGRGTLDVPGLVCLRGTEVAPWSSCAEGWHDPGAVARHLACP